MEDVKMKEKNIVKNLATATLVSGAMLLAVNKPTTAHAADVDVKNNSNETQSNKQDAIVTKDQAQEAVTKAQDERDAAKSQVDEAQKNVDKANETVANAQQEVENATTANDSAKELQKEATPEHISEVQANIKDQTQVVSDKAKAQEEAQKEVNQQSSNLEYAQKDVDGANFWVNEYSNKLAKNQKAIDDAKANLNATQDQINQAQQEVNNDQNRVAETQKAIQDATAKKDQLAEQVKNADQAVSDAQADANNKEASLSQARQKSDEAKSELDQAQKQVSELQAKVDSINTITMPNGYLKRNKWGALATIDENVAKTGYNLNTYKDDPSAEKEVVAHNKYGVVQLTDAQQKELTLWVAGILNDVRTQVGLKPNIVVTPTSLAHTNYIATHSTVPTFDHDTKAIDEADSHIDDLLTSMESIGTPWYAENMNDIKRGVYYHMLSMIFADSDSGWGHAAQLTGLDTSIESTDSNPANPEYFGVSFRNDMGFIQFDSYAKWHLDPKEESQKFAIPNYDSLKADLASTKSALAPKQVAYDVANKTTADAQQAYNSAIDKLTQAKNVQASAKSAFNDAVANLGELNNALVALQSNLKSASDKLDKLTESKSDKDFDLWKANGFYDATKQDLDGAKADADNMQKAYDKVKATYDQAMAKLNQAKSEVKQAQDQLDSLKSNLVALQNADENAKKASHDLEMAQNKLVSAKKDVQDLQVKLDDAKTVLAEKETTLDSAKVELAKIDKEEAAKKAVEKAQEETKKAAEEKAEHTNFYKAGNDKLVDSKGQVMPQGYTVKDNKVYDVKGEFVGVVSSNVQSRVVAHAIAKVEAKEVTRSSALVSSSNAFSTSASKPASKQNKAHKVDSSNRNGLPATSSQNTNLISLIGFAVASVGSLMGLASSKKKQR